MATDHAGLATKEELDRTVAALKAHHFEAEALATGAEAFARIKELIPAGASVMNGASKTLEQIGYIEYLKSGEHPWNNLHDAVLKETDPDKQKLLRKQAVLSDFYLGSAHVVTEDGELVFASNSGSQMPHLAFTSPNIILVVSTKKIAEHLDEAWARIDEHIMPLEDARMKQVYGPESGTAHNKTLILHGENPGMGRHVHVLLVEEDLGF